MSTSVTPAAPPNLPERFGRYRITARLGKGAMGVVYAAFDEQVGRDVALKVMMADLEGDPDTHERFSREARLTSRLQHRNIVTVFDMGDHDGRPYIVMELLKGKTLGQFLREDQPSLEQRLDLMIQTCDGLAAAHAQGICHRDIKPSNLFVLPDGSLKILDFGVARLASSQMTASGLIVGTPDYMSPEQARGHEVDERSDVFSAAAVFYYLLTTRKPFDAIGLPAVLNKVVREDPTPLSEAAAPAPLARMIMKALSKEPEARYQRSLDFSADLARFKRHFDTETRQAATTAHEQFTALLRLYDHQLALRTRAGLDLSGASARRAALIERYPSFAAAAGDRHPVLVPLRRDHLAAVSAELDAAIAVATQERDRLDDIVVAVDAADRQIVLGEGLMALRLLERAERSLDEESRVVADGLARARALVGEAVRTDERVRVLLEDARAADRAGEWTAAIARCEEALTLRPSLPEAASLLASARAAAAAHNVRRGHDARAAQTREDATAQAARAEELWRANDAAGTLRAAEAALAMDDAQALALRLQALARTRLRAGAEAAARAAEAATLVTRARELLASGRVDKAMADAERALSLDPEREEAATLLAAARRQTAQAQAARAQERDVRQRERQAQKLVKTATAAQRAGDHEQAIAQAEAALALVPSDAQARQVLEAARRALADRDSGDTVRLDVPDPDDTAAIAAPTSLESVAMKLGDWAGRLRRRLGPPSGQTTTEWLMVAAVLTFSAIAFIKVVPDGMKRYMLGLFSAIKGIAP